MDPLHKDLITPGLKIIIKQHLNNSERLQFVKSEDYMCIAIILNSNLSISVPSWVRMKQMEVE